MAAALPPRPKFPHPPAAQRAARGRPLDELLATCLTAPRRLDRRVVARLVRELAPDGVDPRLALALLAALVFARGGLLRANDGALLDRLETLWNETLTTDLAAPLGVAVRALAHTALGPALADRLLLPTTTPGTAVAPDVHSAPGVHSVPGPPGGSGAKGAKGANGAPGAEGAAATPPLAGTLLDWLRFLVTRHPEWLDIDALIRRGAGACDRERVLGELVEPLLHHAPESFTPARLSALRGVFGTTQRWRYFAAFLAAEPSAPPASRRRAAAMLRGKLPYRHAATRWRGGGPFRLAVVQNLVFGQEFFDALTAGSVPVYRGAPEVAELAPAPGCYIDAADFASPAALAAHLDRLSGDDAAYAGYHAWRAGGFSAAFRAHLRRLGWPPFARLAERVRAWIAAGRPAAHRPE